MKFLRALIEASKALDPAVITAADVSTYVRQVKMSLKGERITKSAIADAVHELIEDDPKFGSNPGIASQLIAKVQERMMKQIMEGTQEDRCVVLVGKVEKAYDQMSAGKKATYRAALKAFNAAKSDKDEAKMTAALDEIQDLLNKQAEHMGESVEHLEELSKDTLSDYRSSAIDSHDHHEREFCKHMDRRDQARRLQNDHEAIRDFESAQTPVDHEAVKMHDKMAKAQKELGDYHHGEFMKHRRKLQTRGDGIVHAETRLAKESVEHLEELSKELLDKYANTASSHAHGAAYDLSHHADNHYTASHRHEAHKELEAKALAENPPNKEKAKVHKEMADAYAVIKGYHFQKKYQASDRLDKRQRGVDVANVKLRKFSEATEQLSSGDCAASLARAHAKARYISKDEGCTQHVRQRDNGSFHCDDWYDPETTVASYTDGIAHDDVQKRPRLDNVGEGAIAEGWDDEDDEDPDVKIADKEAKKRGIKMLSPKAQAALEAKMNKADKSEEDAASKRAAKSNEEEEEELDDEDYEDPDVKIADREAKKRGIKMLSPKAQKALDAKLAKADKKDEDAGSKKVDESVTPTKSKFFDDVAALTK